jgi:regulator of RNase E activity RraA
MPASPPAPLAPDAVRALAKYDSPTIANAIEAFEVRDPTEGYASLELRCMFPDLPPMVGYAVTCTADSTSPGQRPASPWREFYEAIHNAPKPCVVVMKDIGPNRLRGCHAGDGMATLFQRLGAVGVITDGGVRDLVAVRRRAPGFQMFAPGLVVAHGRPSVIEVGVTVTVCGLTVRPGDLLHGDGDGLVSIPHSVADRVGAEAEKVWQEESEGIDFTKSADFSFEALVARSGW